MSENGSKKSSKKGGWIIVCGMVIALGILGLRSSGDEGRWLRVDRGDLLFAVPMEGTLRSVDTETLGPPIIESIWELKISYMASEGQEVEAGEKVLDFDARQIMENLQQMKADRDSAAKELEKREVDLEQNVRRASLELAEAQARLRKAEFLLDVPEDISKGKEVAKTRLDRDLARAEISHHQASLERLEERRRGELESLRGRRDLIESQLAELEAILPRLKVKAGRDGRVVLIRNRRDEPKKVGDNAWRGEKLIEIPDLSRMRGEADVAESDIGRIAEGDRVSFRLDAHPDQVYEGRLGTIQMAVRPQSDAVPKPVVGVTIEIERTDTERMRPGMRFRGTIEHEKIEGAIRVPAEAVFHDAEGPHVFVATTLGRKRVEPELGRRGGNYFEVLSGLSAGDRVLASGAGS